MVDGTGVVVTGRLLTTSEQERRQRQGRVALLTDRRTRCAVRARVQCRGWGGFVVGLLAEEGGHDVKPDVPQVCVGRSARRFSALDGGWGGSERKRVGSGTMRNGRLRRLQAICFVCYCGRSEGYVATVV